MRGYRENDVTLEVVKLINHNLEELQQRGIPIVSAMPNWINGGTPFGCGGHGCPVTPAIPVLDTCPSSPGRWPITFYPPLPQPLSEADGNDVTVFVLDTLPKVDQIIQAFEDSAGNNLLLQDMATDMKSAPPFDATPPAINLNHLSLSVDLDQLNPEQPATGKDIYGCLVGYPMVDHGLFVAGIIRDLASGANIECIRALNDFGIGDTTSLADIFNYIQNRLKPGGDLEGQRVVVNLSLVATPADEELQWPLYNLTPDEIKPIRDGLYLPMQSLATNFGVVFVASAGNDSDPRMCSDMSTPMGMGDKRWKARYPAQFAYDNPSGLGIPQIIPVGAVKQDGTVASYSNYPGLSGIATYGGELPIPIPLQPDPSVVTRFDPASLDALRGVYSSVYYPALSHLDPAPPLKQPPPQPPIPPPYPQSDAPNPNAWAYWSGTSFATPVISALAARYLQSQPPVGDSVRDGIRSAATQQVTWDKLGSDGKGTEQGLLIMCGQECQPTEQ